MGRLKISVVMCTFNGARFLPEQLDSIATQTRMPDELIVLDDGSSDGSSELIRAFLKRAPFQDRFEVNESNLGSTKNFERAIGLCNGDVIALADQDDIWMPDKVSVVADVLERNRTIGAIFSNASLIDENSQPLGKTLWDSYSFTAREQARFNNGQELQVLLKHAFVTGSTMAFRSELRDLVLPIPVEHIHDHWISILTASVSHIVAIGSPLVLYRKHEAQQIGAQVDDSLRETIHTSSRVPRDYYVSEAKRFSQIANRLCERSSRYRPHSSALGLIEQKVKHREVRGNFPNSKLLRLPSMLREVASFRYWRYSNGLGSLAKDLLV